MQQTSVEETTRVYLESASELCDAREEAEIEVILTRVFLAELTQQYIGRNQEY